MKFHSRSALNSIVLSIAMLGYGAAAVAQIPAESLQKLNQKLDKIDSWKTGSGNENSLDLIVLGSRRPGAMQKSLDGYLQFEARFGKLGVHLYFGDKDFDTVGFLIARYAEPHPDDFVQKQVIGKFNRDLQQELDQRYAPCHTKTRQKENLLEVGCTASPITFLNFLANVVVSNCPSESATQCAQLDGRRYTARREKESRDRTKARNPVRERLAIEIQNKFLKGTWRAVDESGKKVATPMVMDTGESSAALMVVPRAIYAKFDEKRRSEFVVLGEINAQDVADGYVREELRKIDETATANNSIQLNQRQALANVAALGNVRNASSTLGAVMLYGHEEVRLCTIGTRTGGRDVVDPARLAALNTSEFRGWVKTEQKKRYDHVKPDLDTLFASIQSGECNVVIESVPNVIALANGLNRDRSAISVMSSALTLESLANATARTLGFDSDADRQLATSFGLSRSADLKTYRELGLKDKASYDAAVARMTGMRYSLRPRDVAQFRSDEQEAARRKTTVLAIQDERAAAAYAAAAAARARDPFNGLSDEAASRKALAILRSKPLMSESYNSCAEEIGRAMLENQPQFKADMWRIARDSCVSPAKM
jgi:hypothetical protein